MPTSKIFVNIYFKKTEKQKGREFLNPEPHDPNSVCSTLQCLPAGLACVVCCTQRIMPFCKAAAFDWGMKYCLSQGSESQSGFLSSLETLPKNLTPQECACPDFGSDGPKMRPHLREPRKV